MRCVDATTGSTDKAAIRRADARERCAARPPPDPHACDAGAARWALTFIENSPPPMFFATNSFRHSRAAPPSSALRATSTSPFVAAVSNSCSLLGEEHAQPILARSVAHSVRELDAHARGDSPNTRDSASGVSGPRAIAPYRTPPAGDRARAARSAPESGKSKSETTCGSSGAELPTRPGRDEARTTRRRWLHRT